MNTAEENEAQHLFAGGGTLGALMMAKDWGQTSLGNVEEWPQNLKTCVQIILNSRKPMFIWWGKDHIHLFNDAHHLMRGNKQPIVVGIPAAQAWPEGWKYLGDHVSGNLLHTENSIDEGLLIITHRNGYLEETYCSFSLSAVPGNDGLHAGIICTNSDDTQRIIYQRQLHTLRNLNKITLDRMDKRTVFQATMKVLAENPADFPFACLYETAVNSSQATLVNCNPPSYVTTLFPEKVDITRDNTPWHLWQVISSGKQAIARQLRSRYKELPTGPWQMPPDEALILPILCSGQAQPAAVLIVGLNPYRPLDDPYQSFFQLVVNQLANSLSTVYYSQSNSTGTGIPTAIDQDKTFFFSYMSHKFGSLIPLLLKPLDNLLAQPNDNSQEFTQNIKSILRNTLRALQMTNYLLNFSRKEAGKATAQFSPVALGDFTTYLANSFRSVIEKAGLKYEIYCEPSSAPVYVEMEMWETIVLHLLYNAYKYTLQGKILVTIHYEQRFAVLRVTDTGIGIPHEAMSHIFERFQHVGQSTSRTPEGEGISLALVKELVNLHGGNTQVSSTLGKGSVFTVSIPMGEAHLSTAQIIPPRPSYHTHLQELFLRDTFHNFRPATPPPSTTSSANPLVLLVDDNVDLRAVMQRLLLPHTQIITADNGQQALETIQRQRPDLVITDVVMPVMDGLTLLRHLKANHHTAYIPVILLSAEDHEAARTEGYELGADDYLVKPFSAKELLARVCSRLKSNKPLRYTSHQLHNIFERAPMAIALLVGPDFRMEVVNDKMLENTGRTHEALINRPMLEAMPELNEQGIGALLHEAFQHGKSVQAKERPILLLRDGKNTVMYHSFVFEPFRDEAERVIGLLAVANDVTELVRSREMAQHNAQEMEKMVEQRTSELQKANDTLSQTNKELEQFAYVSSHDLQEPLRKIQTFSDLLLQNNSNPNFESGKYLLKIHNAASRMSSLIKDLLSFSRVSRMGESFKPTDLEAILRNVRSDYEVTIREKGAEIYADPLPVINAIPVQLSQLFSNMVGNSLKFTEQAPRIYIRAMEATPAQLALQPSLSKQQRYLRLEFSDNGIGFDQSYADQIFTIFQRLHDRHTYPGTGIGLAICKKIVLHHGGAIYAQSSAQKGASFIVFLPW
ncbi:PAS domain S-box-containing protein [Chitinophaga costaii]|uniref:histidine kinase n=1 Tax=Chitinophaga costaii TaxID=1335309 RepID=A0A1C4E383_9BACT|nr:ATP-binding protein [Chitinophaga costaii]PUZ24349.1 PAS domain-containing protein [Chitinophaga costaii]SCC38010.1 PAS domain S-box-containing protein [Chitinophaga costaii]